MNTKALIATLLVIGSSTVALADSDRGVDKDMDARRRLPVWSVLSSQDQLASGRVKIKVASRRQLSELRLTATRGSLEIEKIQVKFTDGDVETFTPDQIISRQTPSITVNLPSHDRVKTIVVFGKGNRRSSFEILAA